MGGDLGGKIKAITIEDIFAFSPRRKRITARHRRVIEIKEALGLLPFEMKEELPFWRDRLFGLEDKGDLNGLARGWMGRVHLVADDPHPFFEGGFGGAIQRRGLWQDRVVELCAGRVFKGPIDRSFPCDELGLGLLEHRLKGGLLSEIAFFEWVVCEMVGQEWASVVVVDHLVIALTQGHAVLFKPTRHLDRAIFWDGSQQAVARQPSPMHRDAEQIGDCRQEIDLLAESSDLACFWKELAVVDQRGDVDDLFPHPVSVLI